MRMIAAERNVLSSVSGTSNMSGWILNSALKWKNGRMALTSFSEPMNATHCEYSDDELRM